MAAFEDSAVGLSSSPWRAAILTNSPLAPTTSAARDKTCPSPRQLSHLQVISTRGKPEGELTGFPSTPASCSSLSYKSSYSLSTTRLAIR